MVFGCARLEDLITWNSDEGADRCTFALGSCDDGDYSMYCITYNCLYLEVFEAAGNVTEDDILKFGSDIFSTGWVIYCSDGIIRAVEEPKFYADEHGNIAYFIKAPERKNAVTSPPDAR